MMLTYSIVSVWAAVDQELSDRIAAAVGHSPVNPLEVKPASEAVRFRANLGYNVLNKQSSRRG